MKPFLLFAGWVLKTAFVPWKALKSEAEEASSKTCSVAACSWWSFWLASGCPSCAGSCFFRKTCMEAGDGFSCVSRPLGVRYFVHFACAWKACLLWWAWPAWRVWPCFGRVTPTLVCCVWCGGTVAHPWAKVVSHLWPCLCCAFDAWFTRTRKESYGYEVLEPWVCCPSASWAARGFGEGPSQMSGSHYACCFEACCFAVPALVSWWKSLASVKGSCGCWLAWQNAVQISKKVRQSAVSLELQSYVGRSALKGESMHRVEKVWDVPVRPSAAQDSVTLTSAIPRKLVCSCGCHVLVAAWLVVKLSAGCLVAASTRMSRLSSVSWGQLHGLHSWHECWAWLGARSRW